MTKSYSGGLVYEYSQEESKYGLVEIDGNNVNELPDFTALKSAFAGTPNPTGDGGYLSNGQASQCPSQSKTWDVTLKSNELPSLPDGAKDFFTKGAGDGPGLKGDGSQDAGSSTPDIGDAGAGAVTSGGKTPTSTGSPTSSAGAAANVRPMSFGLAPIVCGAVVLASSLFGGALVL